MSIEVDLKKGDAASPVQHIVMRETPKNIGCEPNYPGLENDVVCFSIRFPEWISHKPNEFCKIEEAHKISKCNYWKVGDSHHA